MSERSELTRRARLAATAALTVAGMAGVAACGSSGGTRAAEPGSPTQSPAATASGPSGPGGPSGPSGLSSPSTTPPTVVGSPIQAPPSATTSSPTNATVYFVATAAGKPRLFGETAQVPKAAPLAGAAQALMRGPRDPDYRSAYRKGAFGDVSYQSGKGFTVVLLDPSLEQQGSLTKEQARIAVQQLVYTLQSVQGVKKMPVTVVAHGRPVPLFGVDTSRGVKPTPQLSTLGLVNILTPQNGQAVSGKLTVSGEASSFEANVPWQLTDHAGKVVKHGSAMAAGWMNRLYPWHAQIDLTGVAPGQYTLDASTSDPSGGAEGHGATTDTKTITVK